MIKIEVNKEAMEPKDNHMKDSINTLITLIEANELEASSMIKLQKLLEHGYKFININIRKDGKDYIFQGDWLSRLFRNSGNLQIALDYKESCKASKIK